MSTSAITFDEAVEHRDRERRLNDLAHAIAIAMSDAPTHPRLHRMVAEYRSLRFQHDEFQARLDAANKES